MDLSERIYAHPGDNVNPWIIVGQGLIPKDLEGNILNGFIFFDVFLKNMMMKK